MCNVLSLVCTFAWMFNMKICIEYEELIFHEMKIIKKLYKNLNGSIDCPHSFTGIVKGLCTI